MYTGIEILKTKADEQSPFNDDPTDHGKLRKNDVGVSFYLSSHRLADILQASKRSNHLLAIGAFHKRLVIFEHLPELNHSTIHAPRGCHHDTFFRVREETQGTTLCVSFDDCGCRFCSTYMRVINDINHICPIHACCLEHLSPTLRVKVSVTFDDCEGSE